MQNLKLFCREGWDGNYFVQTNYGPLLVDSGASGSQLPIDACTAGLLRIGTRTTHGITGSVEQTIVQVSLLQAGGMQANLLEVTLDERLYLLGNDVLGKYAYTFDLKRMELRLIEPFRDGLVCLKSKSNHLFAFIRVGAVEGLALIDTGACISMLDPVFCPEEIEIIGEEICCDASGTETVEKRVKVRGLQIGGVEFAPHEFILTDHSGLTGLTGERIIATIGVSTMALKQFSMNPVDGFIKIEEY